MGDEGWGIVMAFFFGTDNDALPRVLTAATEAVMTNGTDDDALPRVPVTDVAIETMSAVGE